MATAILPGQVVSDTRIIGLISSAHFFSHLYILCLPPLLPALSQSLGVSITALGVAIAVLNVTTILLQAPLGVLVDRVGAAAILIAGHTAMALAIGLVGIVPGYWGLLALMVLAGVGNAVYHPADYAILGTAIGKERVGRAFAIHTFGGYAGFAAAPLLMVTVAELWGWRWAFLTAGLLGLLVSVWLVADRKLLGEATGPRKSPAKADGAKGEPAKGTNMKLWTSPPVLMGLLFFFLLALGHGGFTGFSVVALERRYGLSLAEANAPLAAYLMLSTIGVLAGGWLADKLGRHGLIVTCCSIVVASMALLVALLDLPLPALVAIFAVGGFASGIVAPSRDMLVRAITPPGSSGKVFGFVMTGFNIGGLVGPPLYGSIVDSGRPDLVFVGVAFFSLATAFTVWGSTRQAAGTPAA